MTQQENSCLDIPSAVRWYKADEVTIVAGRKIGGNVYVGSIADKEYWKAEYSGIVDPDLPVATTGSDKPGQSVNHWPNYCEISPEARAAYLDWLASSRNDRRIGIGYVFMYFYGLEKRFFLDHPDDEEKEQLINEVYRLISMYGGNYSVQQYLGAFLDVAQILTDPDNTNRFRFEQHAYELPFGLRYAMGKMIKERTRLNAYWVFQWYVSHPETHLDDIAKREFREFRALFTELFNERHPNGIQVKVPRRYLQLKYRAASTAFDIDLTELIGDIPDVSGMLRPLTIAREIAEKAVKALQRYSHFLTRYPDKRNSIESYTYLPRILWKILPRTELENLRHWANNIIKAGGFVPVAQVIERIEGFRPYGLTSEILIKVTDTLARFSIGMAPDPRFALRSPKIDEPVVLFQLSDGTTLVNKVSDLYLQTLITIAMGSFVANSEGKASESERDWLQSEIQKADLSGVEKDRLNANLKWLLTVEPDLRLLSRKMSEVPKNTHQGLAHIALSVATVDGAIGSGKIKAVEKLYKAMKLPVENIFSDLHQLTARSEPVLVRSASEEVSDSMIPSPPDPEDGIFLNRRRIATIEAETLYTSSILREIFYDDSIESEFLDEQDEDTDEFEGLDPKHGAFVRELLKRPHWIDSDFTQLVQQFQLMQDGAMETVNEWSYGHFDDALIEEYDGFVINQDVVAMLKE